MAKEKEKPLTRKDVLKAIADNGGKTEGLDLSNQRFVEAIDLSDLDLSGIKLNNVRLFRVNFNGSNLDRAIMQKAYLGYATFNPLKSKVASLQGVDLRGSNLHNAEFKSADLTAAQFQGVQLHLDQFQAAQLQGKLWEILPASLEETDFRGTNLFLANFKGCYFYGTKFEGAYIRGADITIDTHLGDADWGNYKIGEEIDEGVKKDLDAAEHRYRHLKMWYTQSGYYDIAAKFYYREMEAKRKNAQAQIYEQVKKLRIGREFLHFLFRWREFGNWLRLWIYRLTCGYGERPWQVVAWGMSVLVGSTLLYFSLHGVAPYDLSAQAFLGSLYYSAVSFTALGYGPWFSTSSVRGWAQGVGAAEAIIGVFTIALFLITFVRKMTR